MYYELSLKVTKTNEQGNDKEIKEKYFVDGCELFAEAELKGIQLYNNECEVISIKQSKVREFINERNENKEEIIYIAVIEDSYVNENNGETKKMKYEVGLFAEDMKNASRITHEYMKQGLNDMELVRIYKTNFLEII
jgi:phosphopantetheine adenylyltransferase